MLADAMQPLALFQTCWETSSLAGKSNKEWSHLECRYQIFDTSFWPHFQTQKQRKLAQVAPFRLPQRRIVKQIDAGAAFAALSAALCTQF